MPTEQQMWICRHFTYSLMSLKGNWWIGHTERNNMAFLLKETFKFPKDNFKSMKYQPYELKPSFSMYRVYEWYQHWNGMVYVSFFGDWTVQCCHIVTDNKRKRLIA